MIRERFSSDRYEEHGWLYFILRISKQAHQRQLTKREIIDAEQRLSDLGYWTGPIDGSFDGNSEHALIAFQKIEGRKRTGKLTASELEALRLAALPEPRDSTYPHVEVDLTRQVLATERNTWITETHIVRIPRAAGSPCYEKLPAGEGVHLDFSTIRITLLTASHFMAACRSPLFQPVTAVSGFQCSRRRK